MYDHSGMTIQINQILYDYTVEVRNRFKGRDLIDRVPDELWTEVHYTVQETKYKITITYSPHGPTCG